MTNKLLAVGALLGISGTMLAWSHDAHGSAVSGCNVRGVWERVATIGAGKRTDYTTARQYKTVTKGYFMWVEGAVHRDTIPLKTPLDSARHYGVSGGYGTYDVSGHKYTEHISFFVDPAYERKSFTSSCRVVGNQWYHSYRIGDLGGIAGRSPNDSITEIWRRVE
ncbi:MAG: hypothetical protein PVSMB1_08560 [Gemmatimonadaceae bacterium]